MEKRRWEEKFWSTAAKGEKLLLKVVVLGFVALVIAQSLLTNDSMRFYLSWAERLEGEPFGEWVSSSARVMDSQSELFANLTVELQDFSSLAKAGLLINGEKAADFRLKQVTVKVFPGDTIEIDGSFYSRPLTFKVVQASSHLSQPCLHQLVQTDSNRVFLGKVKLK